MRYINPVHAPTCCFNIIPPPSLSSKVVSFIPAYRQKFVRTSLSLSLPCVLHTPPINVCSFLSFLHFEINVSVDMFEGLHKTLN